MTFQASVGVAAVADACGIVDEGGRRAILIVTPKGLGFSSSIGGSLSVASLTSNARSVDDQAGDFTETGFSLNAWLAGANYTVSEGRTPAGLLVHNTTVEGGISGPEKLGRLQLPVSVHWATTTTQVIPQGNEQSFSAAWARYGPLFGDVDPFAEGWKALGH